MANKTKVNGDPPTQELVTIEDKPITELALIMQAIGKLGGENA